MIHQELVDYAKRKKLTGKLLIIFMVMMVLLTFFSSTINNFTLPRVILDKPIGGALIKQISGQGTIQAKSVIEQYTDTNMKVSDVNVKVGDAVKKGQPVLSMDTDNLNSSLQDENAKYEQMKIILDRLQDSSNLATYDNSIQTALENKNQKTKEYQDTKILYDNGVESVKNLENAETAMNTAKWNYDVAVQAKEAFVRNSQRDIENAKLNLEIQARKIDTLKKQVTESKVYTAPADGIVTELNFSKGSIANSSKPLFKLAETSGGFQLEISADRDLIGYVNAGDSVDVSITSLGDKMVGGKIAEVKEDLQNGDNKILVIDVNDEELKGGENAQVNILKKTKQYSVLVPNSAVYNDNNGSYVFVVKKKDGPLGSESYVQRVDVIVEDSDSAKSAIVNGIMPMDKIVTSSTKALSDGDKVVVAQ